MPRLKSFKYDELADRALRAWQRDEPEAISVDCESSGFTWADLPFGATIAWKDEAHYIELGDFIRECQLCEILARTPTLIFHNAKFDMRMFLRVNCLERKRLTWDSFHDTESINQLLDHDRPNGLKKLAHLVLNQTTDEDEVLKVVRRKMKLKASDGYDLLPRQVLIPYAITDARMTYDLWEALYPELQKKQHLMELYAQERKLTLVLLDMEMQGMATRLDYVEPTIKEYGLKILKTEQAIAELTGIEGFNPNSPKQVLEAFASRGIQLESTGKEVLAGIEDPLADLLMDLRKASKLRSTYLVPLLEETFDGVLHPNLRQHGTCTGRMSAGEASN